MSGSRVRQTLKNIAKKSDLMVRLHREYVALRRLRLINTRYLAPNGYWNAVPRDAAGEALPWFTYPAIAFLKDLLQKDWKVFEYGCGYSTVFWNHNCAKTVSVEHDPHWFDLMKGMHPDFDLRLLKEGEPPRRDDAAGAIAAFEARHFNLPLSSRRDLNVEHGMLNTEFEAYAATLAEFPKGYFDVVVVDGMARSLCMYLAAEYVSEDGIIVLDNSDRWQYNDLQDYLIHDAGFKRIDFHGLGPVNPYGWTTSLFFKNADCLLKAPARRPQGAGELYWPT